MMYEDSIEVISFDSLEVVETFILSYYIVLVMMLGRSDLNDNK